MKIRRLARKLGRKTIPKRRSKQMILVGAVALGLIMMYRVTVAGNINPAAYIPLLNTIAKGESGGNYNAYFGNAANTTIRFTDMTVGDVLDWQAGYVENGSVSNAVGKYQIIRPTLIGLVNELHIDQNEKFNEALQDKLAIALLERRGAADYVNNKLTREQFAANLAMEWAALPKVTGPNPHDSYYASDGINKSNITVDEMYKALGILQSLARKR